MPCILGFWLPAGSEHGSPFNGSGSYEVTADEEMSPVNVVGRHAELRHIQDVEESDDDQDVEEENETYSACCGWKLCRDEIEDEAPHWLFTADYPGIDPKITNVEESAAHFTSDPDAVQVILVTRNRVKYATNDPYLFLEELSDYQGSYFIQGNTEKGMKEQNITTSLPVTVIVACQDGMLQEAQGFKPVGRKITVKCSRGRLPNSLDVYEKEFEDPGLVTLKYCKTGMAGIFIKPKQVRLLPSWAVAKEVQALWEKTQKEQPGLRLPMGCCVGPAVWKVFGAAAILWLPMGPYCWLAYSQSTCTEDNNAVYPWWMPIVFLPIALVRLALEFQCLTYAIVSYIQVTGKLPDGILPTTWKPKFMPFEIWLLQVACLSALSLQDFMTDTLFAATTLKSEHCDGNALKDNWPKVVRHSFLFLDYFPEAWIDDLIHFLPASRLIWFVWLLTFVQVLWAALSVIPRAECCHYKVGMNATPEDNEPLRLKYTPLFQYFTDEMRNHWEVLAEFADATGMASIMKMHPAFPHAVSSRHLTTGTAGMLPGAINAYKHMMYHSLRRLVFYGLLENAFQSNIQIAVFAYNRSAMKDKTMNESQIQALFAIFTAFAMAWLDTYQSSKRLLTASQEILEKITERETESRSLPRRASMGSNNWSFVKRCIMGIKIVVVVILVLQIFAAVKLFFAFWCDDSLVSFPSFQCVELS